MPHESLEVTVEPNILRWARESIGFRVQEIARKLNVSEDTISNLESGRKKPTLKTLETLANVYKRPLAAFFLPEPPVEPPLPKDFRTLPVNKRKSLSSKTRLAIRRSQRLQSLAVELAKNLNREIIFNIRSANLSDDPEVVANKIREILKVKIQTQFDWHDEKEALNEWKKIVERHGILVFQMSLQQSEGIRGFSLSHDKFPAIVLNLKDSNTGRTFSLFHEYGHLILNNAGICDMEDADNFSEEAKSIEKFCNHFAGAFLVPKDALLNHHRLIGLKRYPPVWSDEILQEIAKSFKVSQEVILRRLLILGLSTADFYKRKHEEWEIKTKEEQGQKKWGKSNPPKKCIQENGVPFVSLVLETYREEKITYSNVADYLAIRLKHLPKIEQIVKGTV